MELVLFQKTDVEQRFMLPSSSDPQHIFRRSITQGPRILQARTRQPMNNALLTSKRITIEGCTNSRWRTESQILDKRKRKGAPVETRASMGPGEGRCSRQHPHALHDSNEKRTCEW